MSVDTAITRPTLVPISRVTVAICTWNRQELLAQTLEAMTKLVPPPDVAWELLVVDNNCTDGTAGVIEQFADRLPIRRIFEPTPGLSNARNRAVHEATGEYILWTDDDVLVAHDWLVQYCGAFAEWPDAVIFGGPIAAWFPNTPPMWLEIAWPRVSKAYAAIDYGDTAMALAPDRMPFGANMVMRTAEQRRHLYDPELGVGPTSRVGGEETHVMRSMFDSGATGRWVPGARVRHYIPVHRQTRKYLRDYYRAHGEYITRYSPQTASVMVFGRPRWLWSWVVTTQLKYWFHRVVSKPAVWIEHLIVASTARGQLRGYSR